MSPESRRGPGNPDGGAPVNLADLTASELAERFADGARGEICIVVAGAGERASDLPSGVAQVLALVADGSRLKDASAEVADATGLSRRELYEAALRAR